MTPQIIVQKIDGRPDYFIAYLSPEHNHSTLSLTARRTVKGGMGFVAFIDLCQKQLNRFHVPVVIKDAIFKVRDKQLLEAMTREEVHNG